MSHDLTQRSTGQWEFAYSGDAPWHGLGVRLPGAATTTDIITAAGLDWLVLSEPVYLQDGSRVSGYRANVRSDNKEVLGVVSDEYRVFQNGDALQFVDSLVGEAAAIWHTAGSIRGGRQIFASAKLPTSTVVLPDDVLDHYLLCHTAHDGSRGLHYAFTDVRVVCHNTLRMALGRIRSEYVVNHVGTLAVQLAEAKRALRIATKYFEVTGRMFQAMSAQTISALGFEQFLSGFLPFGQPVTSDMATPDVMLAERARAATAQARRRVTALFEGGLGTDIPGVRGTVWGAYNAGIEWIDRVRTAKQDGTLRKRAAEAAIFGDEPQRLRQRAIDTAVKLL